MFNPFDLEILVTNSDLRPFDLNVMRSDMTRYSCSLFFLTRMMLSLLLIALLAAGLESSNPARGAELTAREVTATLFRAKPSQRVDFSSRDMRFFDLSDLDFKKANLADTDLYGADLTHANLSHTILSGARLDRTTIIGAEFNGANMAKVTLLRPTTSSNFSRYSFNQNDSVSFVGANLSGARFIAVLDGSDFSNANLRDSDFSPLERRGSQWATVPRSQLMSANFTGANLQRANFNRAFMPFAKFIDADLGHTSFKNTDLSSADLTGADITGADFTGAIMAGVKFNGVTGQASAKGLSLWLSTLKAPSVSNEH